MLLFGSAVFLVTAGAALGAAYSVTPILPPVGLTNVQMNGINSSGQVAGFGGTPTFAFVGSAAGSTLIPLPPGWAYSQAYGINDSGQVAGYGAVGANYAGFIATVSGITTIPVPLGLSYAIADGISPSGLVTGFGANGAFNQAFVGATAIPLPPGWGNSGGFAVNDSGQVAGHLANSLSGTTYQAFVGTATGVTPIALPSGWTYSFGTGLNASGEVVGYGGNGSSVTQAFIYSTSGTTIIPLPSGASLAAIQGVGSINDSGAVVGYSDAGAWIWSSAQGTVILNTQVPAGWNIINAYGISENGLILALGTFNGGAVEYVVLSPFPCFLSINPTTVTVNTTASSGAISIATGTGCNWTAASDNSWITISSSASGMGNGTVNFDVAGDASAQPLTGTITVRGAPASQTFTVNQQTLPPAPPALVSPTSGAAGVSLTPTLTWAASPGATSYDVYFGPSVIPLVANTTATMYAPQGLSANTTYYWQIVAKNVVSNVSSAVSTFTTFNPTCLVGASPSAVLIGYSGGPGVVNVSGPNCPWTATSATSWLTVASGAGTGNGTISFAARANTGAARIASVAFANQTVNVMQGGSPTAQFFNDVPSSDPYFDYISLMYTDGITAGCSTSPALYCPDTPVTRAQMSVFLVAAIDRALGTSLAYTPTPYFQDVPSTSNYFPFVQRIKDLGITAGCQASPALFCPDASISQGQMAVFMIVGWMLANNLNTFTYTTTPYFTDVQPGDLYFKFVQKMRDLGFWSGCSQTSYCENSAVTRDQMAPMIMRSLLAAP